MGIIATDDNQITLIYNSNSTLGKESVAYANASQKKLNVIDISKTEVTTTQWVEVADHLNIKVEDLIDKNHPDFVSVYNEDVSLKTEDWLKVIENTPQVVRQPILILGSEFFQIETASEVSIHIDDAAAKQERDPRSNSD